MATNATADTVAESPMVRLDRRKLRRLRQLAGLTQGELGLRASVTNSYIGHLERGSRPTLSPGAFVRICDALGVQDRTELLATDEVPGGGK